MPANREPVSTQELVSSLDAIRKRVEARGVDVAGRMKELGLEDDTLFEDPWRESGPATKRKAKASAKKRK